MVDCTSLENWRARKGPESSNLSLSALEIINSKNLFSSLKKHILQDLFILFVSIVGTVFLVKTGLAREMFGILHSAPVIASFLAGLFFTSVITIAPAAVAISEIALSRPVIEVAFFGAFGAAIGDLILFLFIQKRIGKDIDEMISESVRKNTLSIFRFEFLRWLNPVLGMLMIVSPLPDELGVALLAFSKVKPATLFGFCFFFHFLGIMIIVSALRIFI